VSDGFLNESEINAFPWIQGPLPENGPVSGGAGLFRKSPFQEHMGLPGKRIEFPKTVNFMEESHQSFATPKP
jgi:hypothetical protein